MLAAGALLAAAVFAPPALAATITVNTTAQRVANVPGSCSLQEAIYASALKAGKAPDPANQSQLIDTGCTAGTGTDTIVLAAGAVYQLASAIGDPYNFTGATGNPMIVSTIIIVGNGARIERSGQATLRAFAVGAAPQGTTIAGVAYGGTPALTVRNLYVKGFAAKGGNGADGGGGGLGAGGAIFVAASGALTVELSTFEGNTATGGNGAASSSEAGGGGGGLTGAGAAGLFAGGGGGGARGDGGQGANNAGGGGGGTANSGNPADSGVTGGTGGFNCGGGGGNYVAGSGIAGSCAGGAGGGGATNTNGAAGSGGNGNYGGGGGGGGSTNSSQFGNSNGGVGGHGGFGGGGGAGGDGANNGGNGGNGGFGAGGGGAGGGPNATNGTGGRFGGNAGGGNGGGGAGIGGAIFSDGGTVIIRNSTFSGNTTQGGAAGALGSGATAGESRGSAIFVRNGALTILNSTISGNNGPNGVLLYSDDSQTASLTTRNSIFANTASGQQSCDVITEPEVQVSLVGNNNLTDAFSNCAGTTQIGAVQLGALQINAPGTTPTMAIDSTSPAYNAGDNATCLATDQRGVVRPQFATCDIGAFEWQKTTPTLATQAAPTTVKIGQSFKDTATLSGGTNPTGTITFNLYAPDDPNCTSAKVQQNVTVNGNGSYDSTTYNAIMVGTYRWKATYNGDANNDQVNGTCNDANEQVTVSKATPTIATQASPTQVPIGTSFSDTATLAAGYQPTGQITFSLYAPDDTNCTGPKMQQSVSVNGNGSYGSPSYQAIKVGTYRWKAVYGGDANNEQAAGTCNDANEQVEVIKATPSFTTQASASVVVGGAISDVAKLSGGYNPTGSVSFRLYDPNDPTCSGAPIFTQSLNGGPGSYGSFNVTTNLAGTWRWVADYSGDANNNAVNGVCDTSSENVVVQKATPAVTTLGTPTLAATIGTAIGDTARVAGGYNPTGTLTFSAYGPADATCSQAPAFTTTVSVAGNGNYASPKFTPTAIGTYSWVASYGGDANNNAVANACGEQLETITLTPQIPALDRGALVALALLLAMLGFAGLRRRG